jgi:PAS domain S-box-containing protein
MPDGSIKHLHDLAHRVRDETGNEEVVGAIVDITHRKISEEAIRRSEAYLAEAQELSHTGSFGWKVSSGDIFWSAETFRIFQCGPETKPTVDLVLSRVHPDDREVAQQHIDRAQRSFKEFVDFEHRLQLPDGVVKHVHVTAHPSRDGAGNVEFVGAITDVTQQRRAEAVIRAQEAELRDVVDTIPAIVWSARPDGANSYVNSRFVEYCGMPPDQIAGTGWHAATHPDDLERHNAKWLACVASGEPLEDEVRFRRADGQYRWHLQRGVPLRDEAGRVVKWYGVLTDMLRRRKPAWSVRPVDRAREGDCRRGAPGQRRPGRGSRRSGRTTRAPSFDARVEDSAAEDQQESLSLPRAKEFLNRRPSSKNASASCFATVRRTSGSGWPPRTSNEGNLTSSFSPPARSDAHRRREHPKIQRLAAGGTSEYVPLAETEQCFAEALAKSRSTSRLLEVRFAGPRRLPTRRVIARAVGLLTARETDWLRSHRSSSE